MEWRRTSLDGGTAPPPLKGSPFVCPALMRFCGSVGFTLLGLGVIYGGAAKLGVNHELFDIGRWNGKIIGLFVGGIAAGAIGGLMGLGIGSSVHIRSPRGDHAVSVLWHSLANGSMISLFLWGLILQKQFGREGLKRLVEGGGRWKLGLDTIGIDAATCLAIGLLLVATRLMRPRERPRWAACVIAGLPFALAAGFLQADRLGVATGYVVFKSAVMVVALIPAVAYMVDRDRRERDVILERYGAVE